MLKGDWTAFHLSSITNDSFWRTDGKEETVIYPSAALLKGLDSWERCCAGEHALPRKWIQPMFCEGTGTAGLRLTFCLEYRLKF